MWGWVLVGSAVGGTLTVGPSGRDHATVAAAVAAAAPGDVLRIDAGTYAEAVVVAKDLTLEGVGGAFVLTGGPVALDLDGTPTVVVRDAIVAPAAGRGVDLDGGALTLERVVVRGARADTSGGGVHASGGALTLASVTFEDNDAALQGGHLYAANTAVTVSDSSFEGGNAEKGGAIWMLGGSLTGTRVTWRQNVATKVTEAARGGAIRAQDAELMLTECIFSGNQAIGGYGGQVSVSGGSISLLATVVEDGLAAGEYGGGLAIYQSDARLVGGSFARNRATADDTGAKGHGGAVIAYGAAPGTLHIEDVAFVDNVAAGYGGAVRVETGTIEVTGGEWLGNQATYGGAMHAQGPVRLTGARFSGNSASSGGGAVRWRPNDTVTELVIDGSSFEDNVATGPGGAVYASAGGPVAILDAAFYGNSGAPGGAVALSEVASAAVRRVDLCGNAAVADSGDYGAGLYVWESGPLDLRNAVLRDGEASGWGGGLHLQDSAPGVVAYTAFLGNLAASGGGVGLANGELTVEASVFQANEEDGVNVGAGGSASFAYSAFFENVDQGVAGDPSLDPSNRVGVDPGLSGGWAGGGCAATPIRPSWGSPLVDAGPSGALDVDGSRADIGPAGGPDADPSLWTDGDDDGVPDVVDCAPADAAVSPVASEVAYDGVDQDCDGEDLIDVDGDGVAAIEAGGADCDDATASVHPDADEVAYDGVDQDCDGEDLIDVDGDGWAPPDDCDDADPSRNPDATEVRGDLIDQDCDGEDAWAGGDPDDTDGDTSTGDRSSCNCDGRGAGAMAWWAALALAAVRRRR